LERVKGIEPLVFSLGGRRNVTAGVAAGLNEQGIPTARGAGKWSAVQVARLLERLA
jgi:hypothetical protein